jgi:restriction system protein
MRLRMAEKSLFAVLLHEHWWISLLIALVLGGVTAALLPAAYQGAVAVSGFPFAVIAALAAWRQRDLPSSAGWRRQGRHWRSWPGRDLTVPATSRCR